MTSAPHTIDRTTPPAIHPIGEIPIPHPSVTTLPNGATLKVYSGGNDEINRLTVVMDGGRAEAPMVLLPEIMAQALPEGTARLTSAQVYDTLDFNGSWYTPMAHPHHTSATLFSLNRRFSSVLPVFAQLLAEPAFSAREVDVAVERAARNLELQREKPSYHAAAEASKIAMGATHPLARRPLPDDLRNITRSELEALHRRMFNPRHLTIYLAGRIDSATEALVADTLGSLSGSGEGIEPVLTPLHPTVGVSAEVPVPGAIQNSVALTMPAPPRSHPDYIPLRVAVMALGGYFGSRLNANIREEQGLTYGISAHLMGYAEGSTIMISAETDPGYVSPLITGTCAEIADMAKNPPQGEELERLRLNYLTQIVNQFDSPLSVAESMVTTQVSSLPSDYYAEQMRIVQAITPDDLARVSAIYLRPDLASTIVAGKMQ